MDKISVTPLSKGAYFLEFEKADLRVLCNAPADIVKLLYQKGVIRTIEHEEATFETGPNAILLSDYSVQNGQFSNLTEFPILQMLYKQGRLLPNSPYAGELPIMIGSSHQLSAQMDYIYFGNYGIDNEEEIIRLGMSEDEAKEIIRIKKKFAFGNFRKSDELISCLEISNAFKEIKNDVKIRRLKPNVFEFQYEDETKTVDLNLYANESYSCTYPLGHFKIERHYFSLVHSGQGDAWDVSRPCMSSVLIFDGEVYLIDTGPNIEHVLKALGIGVNEIAGLFITHVHDDHFNGITQLMRTEHKLKIYTTPLIQRSLRKKTSILFSIREHFISDFFDFIDLVPDEWNYLNSLEIKPVFSPHPIETYNFYFRCMSEQGYKTYSHMADTVSFAVLENMIEENPKKPGITQVGFNKVKKHYLTKVDVKKVDVGGGMIHGEAMDFIDDDSDKIVFSHTSQPITDPEKLAIGSEVHFGTVDVLIEGYYDYFRKTAKSILDKYFEPISPNSLQHLTNNPIITFSPGTTIIKQDKTITHIYLLITGLVESVNENDPQSHKLGVGNLICEEFLYGESTPRNRYKAETYVRALAIPVSTLEWLIKKQGIQEYLRKKKKQTETLNICPLFHHSLASYQIAHITESTKTLSFKKTEISNQDFNRKIIKSHQNPSVIFILEGSLLMGVEGKKKMIALEKGDFFCENVIYGFLPLFNFSLVEDVKLCLVPFSSIKNIPVILQQLFEVYEKNFSHLHNYLKDQNYFTDLDYSEKYTTGFQDIKTSFQNLWRLYNIFEFAFHKSNSAYLKSSLHNLLVYFRINTLALVSYASIYRKNDSPAIKENMRKITDYLKQKYKKLDEEDKLDKSDLEKIKKWIVSPLKELLG